MKIKYLSGALLLLLLAAPAQSQRFTSASCIAQGTTGWAKCEAVCPRGLLVLHCSYSFGKYSAGDTCKSLARFHVGATNAKGQPYQQPHDRCGIAVQCSNSQGTLSVQGFATCYRP